MIKFGIIGCGYVAQRHAKHVSNHPGAELIGGFDIDTSKSTKLMSQYDGIAYATLEALLNDDQIDIVSVCTPNGDHHLTAIEVLKARKHVLVEKPMAIKKSYAEGMVKLSLEVNKSLFVVKQNRFNPPVQELKKLLVNDELGEIYTVIVNCFWNRNADYYNNSTWKGSKDLDGGTLYTQFSHFIDIVYYLFGDMKILHAVGKNMNHGSLIDFEDTGIVSFHLPEHDAIGSLNYTTSCYEKNMEGSITIMAEHGTIKIGGKYLNMVDYQRGRSTWFRELPQSNPANDYGYYEGSMSNHDLIIQNVVATLNGEERIMTNAYEGLKVVEIIENMYQHIKEHSLASN